MSEHINDLTGSEEAALRRINDRKDAMWNRLHKTDASVKREDTVVIFDYDLAPRVTGQNETDQRADGLCCLTKDSLIVYMNGERVHEIPLASAEDFRITAGVGSVVCECTVDGSDTLICRSDASHTSEEYWMRTFGHKFMLRIKFIISFLN